VAVGVRCATDGMELSEIIKESSAGASKYDEGFGDKIVLSFKMREEERMKYLPGLELRIWQMRPSLPHSTVFHDTLMSRKKR